MVATNTGHKNAQKVLNWYMGSYKEIYCFYLITLLNEIITSMKSLNTLIIF
jgi:hypothetical protein